MKPANSPPYVLMPSLDVQLLYHPIGLVNAVVHWLSEEAMHVDTGRVILERLSEVEITFPHRRDGQTTYHRILARVMQHEAGKSLLRFVHCSREAQLALGEMMANAGAAS